MFKQQVIDFIDAFETVHPGWQLLLEVDWSSGHAKVSATSKPAKLAAHTAQMPISHRARSIARVRSTSTR